MFWNRKKVKEPVRTEPGSGAGGYALGGGEGAGTGASDGRESASSVFLTGDSNADQRSVQVLLEAIARVSESRDLEALLVDIVDRSIEITGAERGLLILAEQVPGGEERLTLRVARSRQGQDIRDDVRYSTSVVKRVLAGNEPVRATVQSESEMLELGRSVFDLKLRAVMCVPLSPPKSGDAARDAGGEEHLGRGVLYVDSRAATREFAPRDLGLFAALSQHISIALENARLNLHSIEKARLEQSLELASAIQGGLMKNPPKDVAGYEVHGWYRPAERTSGDFYDFVKTRSGNLAVVIGDVTGHGIGPALVTATAQASLRSFLRVLPDTAGAVTMLSQDLSERLDDGMFLTLLVLALAPGGACEIVNAGHHPPLLWRKASGTLEDFGGHGAALGMIPGCVYEREHELELQDGDVVLAFTDGLIESASAADKDQLFGEQRARQLFSELCAAGAGTQEITRALAEAALAFSGGTHEDDITLVALKKT
jgi:serine phosphatase RsbU (regulator of sigma subunit)